MLLKLTSLEYVTRRKISGGTRHDNGRRARDTFTGLKKTCRICGKDNALMWFRDRAAHVVGIELASKAIAQFFQEHNLAYRKTADGRYEAEGIIIFNRNIFEMTPAEIGRVDLVYDRAALVALPEDLRQLYRQKIDEFMLVGSKCLLITLEFKLYLGATPPFSITPEEVQSYYGDRYIIDHIEKQEQPER